MVRDARLCQGRQGRLLLSKRAEVQDEVRDLRLQRRGEPRRRRPVAGRLRAEGVDRRRRGKDRRAGEESGELRRVSFRLEPDGDGTRLVFEHSGFDLSQPWSDQAVRGAEFGWAKMLEWFQEALAGSVAQRKSEH